MRSMTGYGRGRCEVAGKRFVVEVRSVNHRFLELKLRLPWADPLVEQKAAQAVRARLERGAVTATVRDEGGGEAPEVTANLPLARAYARALEDVRRACGLDEKVSLELVAAQPGVLVAGEAVGDGESLWTQLRPGVERALDELVAARQREGEALRNDLATRVGNLRRLVEELRAMAGSMPEDARTRRRQPPFIAG